MILDLVVPKEAVEVTMLMLMVVPDMEGAVPDMMVVAVVVVIRVVVAVYLQPLPIMSLHF